MSNTEIEPEERGEAEFIKQDELDFFRKRRDISADSFLKSMIDYLKWTTTFALAALLWISSNLTSLISDDSEFYPINFYAALGSIGLIFIGISISVYLAYNIVRYWNAEWKLNYDLLHILLQYKERRVDQLNSQEQVKKNIPNLVDVTKARHEDPFHPKLFMKYLPVQTICLTLGLLAYIVAVLYK